MILGRAGEPFGAQVVTSLEPSKFEPVLAVFDGTGQRVAEGRSHFGFIAPAAGRYTIRLRDQEYRGGADYRYRLHLGAVPVVTSVQPAGVTRGTSSQVQLQGVHLPASWNPQATVSTASDARIGSKIAVPFPRVGGDPIGQPEVVIGEYPNIRISEDTDIALPQVPGTADGTVTVPGQVHRLRFRAKQGETVIVEVEAGRIGSPLDTTLEIQDVNGNPVPRAVLRSAAKTYVTLRDHDSAKPGIRLESWNELAQDDYILMGEELMRIQALPRNPDDDCIFYSVDNKRRAFLGTTPQHHPFGANVFKVEVHPPHATFPPNGMPVQTLYYRNDDGGAGYGKDACIDFTPPRTGDYFAVVRETSGSTGNFRLTVRSPRPDFAIRVSSTPAVPTPGALPLTVTANRFDEFEGPIAVRLEGLPGGWTAPTTEIQERQRTAEIALAPGPQAGGKFRVVATAIIAGQEVTRVAEGGPLTLDPSPDLVVKTDSPIVSIVPGTEARIKVQLDRIRFQGRVPLDIKGLPHGVRVLNVGLNGILVLPNQTEREITIYAEPWVATGDRPIVVLATQDNRDRKRGLSTEYAAPSVLLRVVPPNRTAEAR